MPFMPVRQIIEGAASGQGFHRRPRGPLSGELANVSQLPIVFGTSRDARRARRNRRDRGSVIPTRGAIILQRWAWISAAA